MTDVGRVLVWLALLSLCVLCWIGAYTDGADHAPDAAGAGAADVNESAA